MENKNIKPVRKAMILMGGLGTRFLPATLCLAKELFPIGNRPIVMYHIADLIKAGVTDIMIVGNVLKEESIRGFFNPSADYLARIEQDGKTSQLDEFNALLSQVKISYINQDDPEYTIDGVTYQNEGLGHRGSAIAILAARGWANGEPFVVLNGDDLCFYKDGTSMTQEVIDVYNKTGDCVIYGKELPREVMSSYSSMVLGKFVDGNTKGRKMLDIIEKPPKGTEPSNVMGFCRYILDERFMENVFNVQKRGSGEYNMTDVIQRLAQAGQMSTCLFTGDYFDCGSMSGYALANAYVALNDPKTHAAVKEGLDKMTKTAQQLEKQ